MFGIESLKADAGNLAVASAKVESCRETSRSVARADVESTEKLVIGHPNLVVALRERAVIGAGGLEMTPR